MLKIKRQNLPQQLMDHLADRVRLRRISANDLITLRDWLDRNPEVPAGDWFKTFENFTICGKGELIKTLLAKQQSRIGQELSDSMPFHGVQARFTDPATGQRIGPLSHPHQIADYLMAALKAGLGLDRITNYRLRAPPDNVRAVESYGELMGLVKEATG